MNKKVIIFDFDGTIADTFHPIVKIANSLSSEFGYEKLNRREIEELRNKNARDVFKYFGISIFKMHSVWKRIRAELNKEVDSLKPVKDIRKVLLKLKKKKYGLGILTSNSKENVSKFLKNNSLNMFDFVYSGSSIFGKDKVMKDLLKSRRLKPEEVIYIGDDTRDIEAARKANIKIIAVSWGFNSRKILERQKPDFLIDKPRELEKILQ